MLQTESEGHGLWAAQHPDHGGGAGQDAFIPNGAKSKSNTVGSRLSWLTLVLLFLPRTLDSHL